MSKVKCPNCEEENLRAFYSSDDDLMGYLCEDGEFEEFGKGCNAIVSVEDFKELKAQAPQIVSTLAPKAVGKALIRPSLNGAQRTPATITLASGPGGNPTSPPFSSSALIPDIVSDLSGTQLARHDSASSVDSTISICTNAIPSPAHPPSISYASLTKSPARMTQGVPNVSRTAGLANSLPPIFTPSTPGSSTRSNLGINNMSSLRGRTASITSRSSSRSNSTASSTLRRNINNMSLNKTGNKSDDEFDDDCLSDSSDDNNNDEEEDELDYSASQQLNEDYRANAFAMASGDVEVQRVPMVSGLNVKGCELIDRHRKPFSMPRQDPRIAKQLFDPSRLNRQMGINRYTIKYLTGKGTAGFVPLNALNMPLRPGELPDVKPLEDTPVEDRGGSFTLPKDFQPLVVWEPTTDDLAQVPTLTTIEVPPRISRWLRPHQREGVQFLCECVLEQRDFAGQGAILADDMGLGKTLQSVALIYTLLMQGFEKDNPVARKIIVCCPTSLVANWANEFVKWIGPGVVNVVALSESNKDAVEHGIEKYVSADQGIQVMVVSYDTFRRHVRRIKRRDCDLLVCDEAHRLKNRETETYKALSKLTCRRRVLLSGTPMQNCLAEFFAMVDFTNPGVLGEEKDFNRHYQTPILRGREPDATDKERAKGEAVAEKLSKIVNQFILRRTNVLLSQHLPPKVIEIVCCALSPVQKAIYKYLINQSAVKRMLAEAQTMDLIEFDDTIKPEKGDKSSEKSADKEKVQVLPLIGALKSLCNHPKLLWEVRDQIKIAGAGAELAKLFPPDFHNNAKELGFHPRFSGKMSALDKLLCTTKANTDDKFVLVSNYTQTLDLFEELCTYRGWNYLRVDGSTTVKRRQELVDLLNKPGSPVFIFLLSSKAGGCGLNMVGANRLVLFDPDWNPAVDKQAAARVWRDGQKKRCFVYRFFATGTIDEKIYQRQLSKEGLADVMGGNNTEASVSSEDLRDLFTYNEQTLSDTHDTLECSCFDRLNDPPSPHASDVEDDEEKKEEDDGDGSDAETRRFRRDQIRKKKMQERANRPRLLWGQRGKPSEEDLGNWAHHCSVRTLPDPMFRLTHSSTFKEPPRPKPGAARQLNLGSSGSSSRKSNAPAAPIRASARLLAALPPKEEAPVPSPPAETLNAPSLPTPVDTDMADNVQKGKSTGKKTPGSLGMVATVSPVKGHNPVADPVVFVFTCEVVGKPLTGRVEEENKRMSCIVQDDAVLTKQARRQEERLRVALLEKEKLLLEEQEKARIAREAAGTTDESGTEKGPAILGGETVSGADDEMNDGNSAEDNLEAGVEEGLSAEEIAKADKNDPNKNKVVMGPRSRLPTHLRPKEDEDNAAAASSEVSKIPVEKKEKNGKTGKAEKTEKNTGGKTPKVKIGVKTKLDSADQWVSTSQNTPHGSSQSDTEVLISTINLDGEENVSPTSNKSRVSFEKDQPIELSDTEETPFSAATTQEDSNDVVEVEIATPKRGRKKRTPDVEASGSVQSTPKRSRVRDSGT